MATSSAPSPTWVRSPSTRHCSLSEPRLEFLRAVSGVLFSALRRLAVEDTLRHQALHDPLTRLPNRLLAADRLGRALERSVRSGTATAVILIDLDDFKVVNDSLGHQVGDALLVTLAGRLLEAVRPEDTVARLGGDEFVVVCADLGGEADAITIAERVRATWSEPIEVAASWSTCSAASGSPAWAGTRRSSPPRPRS